MLPSIKVVESNLKKLTNFIFIIGLITLTVTSLFSPTLNVMFLFLSCLLLFVLIYFILRKKSLRLLLLISVLFLFLLHIPILSLVQKFPSYYFLTYTHFSSLLAFLTGFVCFVFENMTLFKKEGESLIKTAKHENTNRMLGKVARSLIHDICTPLSVLSLVCEPMREGNFKEIRKVENQRDFVNAVDQIVAILKSTNFLMKESSNSVEEFNVQETIKSVISLTRHKTCLAEIEVIEEYLGKEVLKGDRNTFLRIIGNIFLNAIEELEKREKERKIWIKVSRDGKYLVVDITDTGCGMDPDIIEVCDEKYFVSSKTGCVSSGLAFVKESIKIAFNGSMKIRKSKDGKNTVSLHFLRV